MATDVVSKPTTTKKVVERLFGPPSGRSEEDVCLDAGYYVHKKSLGEGGFGKVRLGTHLKTNQKVAIKMMNKEKLGQDLQRVRIEVEALKVLHHNNIAKLLQVIETDTEIFLVLEYCSGGELFDYLIAKRRLTETEVRVIMKDLFKVLIYIHNRGFAHRDLKPENILFDTEHRIKLIDFGLAANSSKNKAELAFLSTCCGSPAYAAPELLKGMTYSGPAVDVWSAGVLLYSLLVGQLPFDDDNVNNLYKKIQMGRYMLPQWLSADVRELISSMLKTNPAERITVAKAIEHRWIKKGFNESPPNSSPPSSPNEIDTKAFQCLRALFSKVPENELKDELKKFGYITATYLLLKNNPEAIKELQVSLQLKIKPLAQQQQQLFSGLNDQPRIAAVKRKLQLDCDNRNNNLGPTTPVKRPNVTAGTPTPKIPNRLKEINRTPVLPPSLIQRKQMLNNENKKSPVPYPAPRTPNRMTGKTARCIVSPKLKVKPFNDENCGQTPVTKSPLAKPSTPQQNSIKSPLQELKNQVLSPPTNKVGLKSPTVMTPKTPLGQLKTGNMTPVKKSSKKSLLKRLMASATPAKSHSPRKLDTSAPTNNITMTTFKDPQECIDRLVKTLGEKGVKCRQKEYVKPGRKPAHCMIGKQAKRKTFLVRKGWR